MERKDEKVMANMTNKRRKKTEQVEAMRRRLEEKELGLGLAMVCFLIMVAAMASL